MDFTQAEQLLALPKHMVSRQIDWAATPRGLPFQKHRSAISYREEVMEGVFVELEYGPSILATLTPKMSFSMIADGMRLVGIDVGGTKAHKNRCGTGLPYYGKRVPQPQLNFPVHDAVVGYCEPVASNDYTDLWQIFLDRANIKTAPPFRLPSMEQGLLL